MGFFKKISCVAILLYSTDTFADNVFTEIECLAENIYFEARNQPWVGKVAIANVTLNRVKSTQFPNRICKVVKQAKRNICQFSWYCDGKPDIAFERKAMEKAREIAITVYIGSLPDVTEGALWYHADYIKQPDWAKKLKETVKINDHIFYTKK